MAIHLRVVAPTYVAVDKEVLKVSGESEETGSFTLLPRHVDYVTALTPGILAYETEAGESFVAINGGILVKAGEEVNVSTAEVVESGELAYLRRAVAESFEQLDEEEQRARNALQKLEADFVRNFMDVDKYGGE